MRTTPALLLAAAATAGFPLVLVAAGLVLLGYLGVVLPAVWSSSPARRKAAAELLHLLGGAREHTATTTRTADLTSARPERFPR